MKKQITVEDMKVAVEASYELGQLAGRDEEKNEMDNIRVLLSNAVTVNKRLWGQLMQEHKGESYVELSPVFVRGLFKGRGEKLQNMQLRTIKKAYLKATNVDLKKDVKNHAR